LRGSLRGVVGNLLLASLSLGFVLGLFEVGMRLAGYRALYEMYSKPSQFWQYDAQLGWFHEPGARGRFVGPRPWPVEFEAEVEINSLGLRGPEPAPAQPGELRVLFLGDSMVAAFEVPYRESFVALLEDDLTARLGRPVRTINAGVRGYGTDQYLLYYRERGRALAPNAVVIFLSANDLVDDTTLHETRRPFGKPALVPNGDGTLRLVGSPVPHYGVCEEVRLSPKFEVVRSDGLLFRALCRAQLAILDHSALFSFITISMPWNAELLRDLYHFENAHPPRPGDPERTWRAAHTDAILLALVKEIQKDGARVLITGAPPEIEALDAPAFEQAGAALRDLGEVWSQPRENVRWNHDSHFNPEGHRRVAAILAPTLLSVLRSEPQHAQTVSPD
jgi:lysophospholipase L1-like esterase